MLKNLRGSLLVLCGLGAISAAVIACSGGTTSPGTGGTSGSVIQPEPQQQAQITAPSGLKVSASIAAASLGEESGAARGAPAQGDCAVGGCGSYSQQSNVQIAFNAGAGAQAAAIQIVKVELVDSATGAVVDTLTASKPQVWNGSTYTAWDQKVTPGGDLKASYDLTAPRWSTIDSSTSGTAAKGTSSWSKAYKLHVTLSIDGVEIILESTDLNRSPVAVT